MKPCPSAPGGVIAGARKGRVGATGNSMQETRQPERSVEPVCQLYHDTHLLIHSVVQTIPVSETLYDEELDPQD